LIDSAPVEKTDDKTDKAPQIEALVENHTEITVTAASKATELSTKIVKSTTLAPEITLEPETTTTQEEEVT
jgi:hypothetical protein